MRRPAPEDALTAGLGALFGVSVLFDGFYDLGVWGLVCAGLAAMLLGLLLARPARPAGPALLAVAALGGLWIWSLCSLLWAESADGALIGSSRWLLYAATLAILLVLLREERRRVLLLGSMGAAVTLVALYATARMALDGGATLFLDGRLIEPLGYINGQAGYLLMGFWPLVALAERAKRPPVAGLALGAAILVTSLAVMSQTRAILPAFAISVVVLMIAVPGRTHRLLALGTIAGGVLVISRVLVDVYTVRGTPEAPAALQNAGVAMLLSAAVFGASWAIVGSQLHFMTQWSSAARYLMGWRAVPLAVALVLAIGALVFSSNDPVQRVKNEWSAFKAAEDTGPETRFLRGGGRRYDYWRVSLNDLRNHPVNGVGADNWSLSYYPSRRTDADTRQPHSLVFQTVSELGSVGLMGLLAFVGAVGWGFLALCRREDVLQRIGVLVASGGIFLMWLAHTSVDWLHVIPGVTGMAIAAAAVILSSWSRELAVGRGARVALGVGVALCLVLGAVIAVRLAVADNRRGGAEDALASGDARVALRRANAALGLNGESLETLYLRAGAYARLNDYEHARADLLRAIEKEPGNFQPYEFLGDVEQRRGNAAEARRLYGRAHALNPRAASIAEKLTSPDS
ncbi:MAG: O-antigen ligase family protein [Thermoleophilaceae bacterium]|nr:O-antigen ligase family protein [Thermoleophilaceae bacterium]